MVPVGALKPGDRVVNTRIYTYPLTAVVLVDYFGNKGTALFIRISSKQDVEWRRQHQGHVVTKFGFTANGYVLRH